MGNINDKINELQPHVLSIRFTKGITVIDCEFKEGWAVKESETVGVKSVPNSPNYYMIYPLNENVGVDEMLLYVGYIKKINVERELKIQLLQTKVKELKELFTKNSLEKCKNIVFGFKDTISLDSSSDEDINFDDMPIVYDEVKENEFEENIMEPIIQQEQRVDEDVVQFNSRNNSVELPPKDKDGKIILEDYEPVTVVCKCDPNNPEEVCPECVNDKY